MANPICVEVRRAERVESVHRGSIAVYDADGAQVLALGDTRTPVFPRSAIKLIQAIPLVESGAADDYGFTAKELALACASHSAEPEHVATAARMLKAAGLEPECLACGPHWPNMGPEAGRRVQEEMIRRGEVPTRLHNNCSGKHAGFVCTAHHQNVAVDGYHKPGHLIQRTIRAIIEELSEEKITDDRIAIDGCSAPNFAVSLNGLARAYAKLGSGIGFDAERASASSRLMKACVSEPFHVAGTGRMCTEIMKAGEGRIFAKVGAEGVYIAAIPELGLGIALKCDDGAQRAAEAMLAAVLSRYIGKDPAIGAALEKWLEQPLTSWAGEPVGSVNALPV